MGDGIRILIEIKGGLVQSVYTDAAKNCLVAVLDWDVQESCSDEEAEEEMSQMRSLQAEIETMKAIY